MLEDLTHTLADLYPDEGSIRRVADAANVPLIFVNLTGNALDVWRRVTAEAERRNAVARLVGVAVGEYPENVTLQRIAGRYQYGPPDGADSSDNGNRAMTGNMGNGNNTSVRLSVLETKLDNYGAGAMERWQQHQKDHREREAFEDARWTQFRKDMIIYIGISLLMNGAMMSGVIVAFWWIGR